MVVTKQDNNIYYDFESNKDSNGPLYIHSKLSDMDEPLMEGPDDMVSWNCKGVSLLLMVSDYEAF